MLQVVRERAGRMRARRRVLATGVATALLFACGMGVALSRGSGGGPAGAEVRVAAPAGAGSVSTSTPSLALEPPPFPVPTNLPSTAVPTTTPATAPTTVPPNTLPSVPVTEPPPAGSAGAASLAPSVRLEPCSPEDVSATAATDKPSYLPGQPVRITGTLRNVSGRECGASSWANKIAVTDPSGKQVWGLSMATHVDCVLDAPCTGTAMTTEPATGCWDQLGDETRQPVPPASYTVKIEWAGLVSPAVSATTTIQIAPDPAAPTTTVPPRCY